MKSKRLSQRGAGLVETMLIVLFIAIGCVAIIKFKHYLTYSTNLTQQQFDATLIGLSKIESLRDFQDLTGYNNIASSTGTQTVGNTTYTLTWTITANTNPTYKTIDITVSWTDIIGGSQSIRLTTRVAGIDPSNSASIM